MQLSRGEETKEGSKVGGVTNAWWLSPERLRHERHGFESDVWAFGVCLWEVLTLKQPWVEQKRLYGENVHGTSLQ